MAYQAQLRSSRQALEWSLETSRLMDARDACEVAQLG
jgi:hypothetical protein